jgi:hypothetical protein
MRTKIFFILFFALAAHALATGVGVVPDRLVFEGNDKSFRILNPNTAELEFVITSEKISCIPEEGAISAKESAEITCTADENTSGNTQILVETAMVDGGSVSMMPAVAVRAEIVGKNDDNKEKMPAMPLVIEKSDEEIQDGEENPAETSTMTPEIAAIAILITAIIAVLAYSEVKKRKISGCGASSPQDSPSGQSSAAASASQSQQQQALSHGATAGNQQPSPPEL